MLDKLGINVNELKANIDGLKSRVNKQKNNYEAVGMKTIDKHVELEDGHIIDISIDVNTSFDKDGREIILGSNNINNIIEDTVSTVIKNTSENMIMPKSIIISSKVDIMEKLDYMDLKKEYEDIDLEILTIERPKYKIDEIVLNNEMKRMVSRIFAINKNKNKIVNEMNIRSSLGSKSAIVCNFYGESGNGKNCVIHAIANEIGKNVMTLNYNILYSIPVKNLPRFIKSVFQVVKRQNAVLVISDSDRLIKEKDKLTKDNYYSIDNIVKSCIKDEIRQFDSILFFKSNTNKIDNYFRRMFFINIEFKNPDDDERKKLWEAYILDSVKLSPILNIDMLVKKYSDISRADINDILFVAASIALEDGRDILYEIDFDLAYNQILGKY